MDQKNKRLSLGSKRGFDPYSAVQFVLFFTLLILLWFRWRVGITRFFDVDELTYLHWTAQIAGGLRPYIDFFLFIPHGFFVFMSPLFWFFRDPSVLIAARIIAYGIFLGILATSSILFGILRSWRWAILPAVLVSFLPMPYDKFLEFRPDNLSTLFAFAALTLEVYALKRSRAWGFVGFLFALSLLVFPKSLPFVLIGMFVGLGAGRKQLMLGFFLPFAFFGIYALFLANPSLVWYSLTKLPFEANRLATNYIMESHLFFFPNSAFYGGQGITMGLILNHAIWVIGILVGMYRLLTPFLVGGKRGFSSELLVAGTFLLLVAGYVSFFPLKHTQYLIPIALFIAFYAADGVSILIDTMLARFPKAAVFAVGVCGIVLISATAQVSAIKLSYSSRGQVESLAKLQSTIPQDVNILDLEGLAFFWPQSYYACCVSFGEFSGYLSRPLPSLVDVLERRSVEYIWQGDSNRLSKLTPADLEYINAHYIPVSGWGVKLWQRR